MAKQMARYSKIESTGSIGSIVLGILEGTRYKVGSPASTAEMPQALLPHGDPGSLLGAVFPQGLNEL